MYGISCRTRQKSLFWPTFNPWDIRTEPLHKDQWYSLLKQCPSVHVHISFSLSLSVTQKMVFICVTRLKVYDYSDHKPTSVLYIPSPSSTPWENLLDWHSTPHYLYKVLNWNGNDYRKAHLVFSRHVGVFLSRCDSLPSPNRTSGCVHADPHRNFLVFFGIVIHLLNHPHCGWDFFLTHQYSDWSQLV